MSLKIVFLLAFLTVVFGLPSPPKKQQVEISKETLRGLPLSALKKPLVNTPKKNQKILGKQANDPSEGLNDEISKEALRGLPSSALKKPLVNTPKKNQKILGKQANDPSEGLNDEISNEALRGLPLSALKKPMFNIAKKNHPNLGKQRKDDDEINQADYDEIDEQINNDEILVDSVPSRMKRATCRNVTFRTKSGKTLTVYRCTK